MNKSINQKKEFSFTTRVLIIFGVVAGLALIIFSLRAFGDATVALTLTTNPDLERGLVGHWTFDGEDVNIATNVITDRSGSGNNGKTFGMDTATTTAFGKIGQAFEFDGVDDYISVPDDDSLDTISAISISTWFYKRSLGNTVAFIDKRVTGEDSYQYEILDTNQIALGIDTGTFTRATG